MNSKDISQARDPLLRNSVAAMKRAAQQARKQAIETGTGIVVTAHGKTVHVSAGELRQQEAKQKPSPRT